MDWSDRLLLILRMLAYMRSCQRSRLRFVPTLPLFSKRLIRRNTCFQRRVVAQQIWKETVPNERVVDISLTAKSRLTLIVKVATAENTVPQRRVCNQGRMAPMKWLLSQLSHHNCSSTVCYGNSSVRQEAHKERDCEHMTGK